MFNETDLPVPSVVDGWFVRITRPKEEVELWCDTMKELADVVVAYEHESSRIHCHVIIANVKCTYVTLKNKWKEVWSGLGHDVWNRSDWSFKPLEPGNDTILNTMTYCSKGKYVPFYRHGVQHRWVFVARDNWEDRPRVMHRQLRIVEQLNPQQMRKKKNQICDEIIATLGDDYTHRNVVMKILDYLRKERIIFSRFIVREYYDTIMGRVENTEWEMKIRMFCNIGVANNVFDI